MNRREVIQVGTAAIAAAGLANVVTADAVESNSVLIISVPAGLNRTLARDMEKALLKSGFTGNAIIIPKGFSVEKLSLQQIEEFEAAIKKVKNGL